MKRSPSGAPNMAAPLMRGGRVVPAAGLGNDHVIREQVGTLGSAFRVKCGVVRHGLTGQRLQCSTRSYASQAAVWMLRTTT